MTSEELSKIPFRMVSHLAMAHEHCATYVNNEYGIGMCKHTKKKNEFEFGRTYTHFMYKGVVYKTKEKLLEAYNRINFIKENNKIV